MIVNFWCLVFDLLVIFDSVYLTRENSWLTCDSTLSRTFLSKSQLDLTWLDLTSVFIIVMLNWHVTCRKNTSQVIFSLNNLVVIYFISHRWSRRKEKNDSTGWSKSHDTQKNWISPLTTWARKLIFLSMIETYLKFISIWTRLKKICNKYY